MECFRFHTQRGATAITTVFEPGKRVIFPIQSVYRDWQGYKGPGDSQAVAAQLAGDMPQAAQAWVLLPA